MSNSIEIKAQLSRITKSQNYTLQMFVGDQLPVKPEIKTFETKRQLSTFLKNSSDTEFKRGHSRITQSAYKKLYKHIEEKNEYNEFILVMDTEFKGSIIFKNNSNCLMFRHQGGSYNSWEIVTCTNWTNKGIDENFYDRAWHINMTPKSFNKRVNKTGSARLLDMEFNRYENKEIAKLHAKQLVLKKLNTSELVELLKEIEAKLENSSVSDHTSETQEVESMNQLNEFDVEYVEQPVENNTDTTESVQTEELVQTPVVEQETTESNTDMEETKEITYSYLVDTYGMLNVMGVKNSVCQGNEDKVVELYNTQRELFWSMVGYEYENIHVIDEITESNFQDAEARVQVAVNQLAMNYQSDVQHGQAHHWSDEQLQKIA